MRRRSAPGPDRVSWKRYRADLTVNLQNLSEGLRDRTWRPSCVRFVQRTTFFGKSFTIAVPTVEDRIVHRALRNAISNVLEERVFCDFVSGFRPGRNRISALRYANQYLSCGSRWVVDIDAKEVSKGCSLEQVMNLLSQHIADGSILWAVKSALSGFPRPLFPGSGLAPLLINLRLTPVDMQLEDLAIVRFCDNYAGFAESYNAARAIYKRVEDTLSRHGLEVNEAKSAIREGPNLEDLFLAS